MVYINSVDNKNKYELFRSKKSTSVLTTFLSREVFLYPLNCNILNKAFVCKNSLEVV